MNCSFEPIREKESLVENGAWLVGSWMEMSEFNHTTAL